MTERQRAFCVAYAQCGNATESALKSGYSQKTARTIGSKLLTNVDIQKELQRLAEQTREQREREFQSNIATAGEIQDFLSKVMRGEITEDTIVVESTGNGFSEARHVDRDAQLKERIKAGETLARMQGLFTTNVSIDGVVPIVLCDDIGETDEC